MAFDTFEDTVVDSVYCPSCEAALLDHSEVEQHLCFECEALMLDGIQRAEMRAETFAAEAAMGMRAGTTEGWFDEPPMGDDLDDFGPDAYGDEGYDDEYLG